MRRYFKYVTVLSSDKVQRNWKTRFARLAIVAITFVAATVRLVEGQMPQPVLPQMPDTSTHVQADLSLEDYPPEFTTAKPQGRGEITRDFLTSYLPMPVARPAYLGSAPEIDEKTAVKAATERAKWEWGESVRLGTVVPLISADGSIWAYDVDFTIDGSIFGDYVEVASEWQKFCGTRTVNQEMPLDVKGLPSEVPRELGSKKYGSITVSATYDTPPIISSRPGVSNFYASGWVAFEIAKGVLGTTEPVLEAVYLYGPWERAYEFKGGSSTIVVEGQEPWSWYLESEFQEASNTALQQRKDYVFKLIREAGIDSSVLVDSVKETHRIELEKWLNQGKGTMSPQSNHFIPGYNSSFVPFEWFGGCAPTSGAMVLNYYDESYWYGKLTYWFQRKNCPVYGDIQCHNAHPISSSLRSYMGTNDNGITLGFNIYPGMVNYANDQGYCFGGGTNATCSILGWCWDAIVAEINGGYPFAYSLSWYPGGTHAVAVVGYEDVNQDVWCYNTHSTGSTLEKVHHSGGVLDLSFVASPHPGCEVQYDVKLTSLDGFQEYYRCGYSGSVTGGQTATISWSNFGHPGHHVNIFYSTNGGGDWTSIASTEDDGSYIWQVPCYVSTEEARILIQQFSSTGVLQSSDGSYGDFKIIGRTAPSAPSWCGTTNDRCGYVEISWENVSDEDGYKVYRDGSATPIGPTGANVTSYRDYITGTHSYRVKAYNICSESGYSPSVNGTGLTTPSAPGSLTASDNYCGYILVSWQNVTNESGYKLYRDGSGTPIATPGVDQTSYQDNITGTHSYKVRANNGCGESGDSPSDNGKGWTSPSAPSWCSATDNSCGYIDISWENVSEEDGYQIYRDGSPGFIDNTGANVTSYRDNITGTHSYRVKAYNNVCGTSAYSPSDNGTGLVIPSAPSNCIASDDLSDKVHFSWQDNSNNEDGFKVYRNGSYLGSADANVTYYDDYSASPGVTYSYCAKAYNNLCGESGQCSDDGTRKVPPVAPSNCVASDNLCDKVHFSWQDNSNNEDGFVVYRDGIVLDSVDANITSYDDNSAFSGVGYSYCVSAYNINGESETCCDAGIRIVRPPMVIHVPADAPTIQAGINGACNGDTVLVAEGTYKGDGNRDLDVHGKAIVIKSNSGPKFTVLDCEGEAFNDHRGFYFHSGEDSLTVLEGLTVKNGSVPGGGAILCESSSPTIHGCVFQNNLAYGAGGGGGIQCMYGASPVIKNCTFVNNIATNGAAVWNCDAYLKLHNSLIAFNAGGGSVYCGPAGINLTCSDIYGNVGGDWTGCIAGLADSNGNFSANPIFCDTTNEDYSIRHDSPCAPFNNNCGTLVGALAVGCFSSPPPHIVSVSPAQNELNVEVSRDILVTFDINIDPTSLNNSTFIVNARSTGAHKGLITYDSQSRTATFKDSSDFDVGELVTVILTKAIRSFQGIPMNTSFSWSFNTAVDSSYGKFAIDSVYTVSARPASLFAADLDGDGDMDLATANDNSNNVSVLLNNGDGTFGPQSVYQVGQAPYSVYASDFNRDGYIDLATANWYSSSISVLLNNGNGTFGSRSDYPVGTYPLSIFAADLNGDGNVDLMTANQFDHNISILFNDGTGHFSSQAVYSVGSYPLSVYAADLDNDGDIDLAVANNGSSSISVLFNNGDGAFSTRVDYVVGDCPTSVFAADLDKDGDLDLATANGCSHNVSILFNSGTGNFVSHSTSAVGGSPKQIYAADLDGDDDFDLVTANWGSNDVSVLLNNGSATFVGDSVYSVDAWPNSVFPADFDHDFDLDLAVSSMNGNRITILWNLSYDGPVWHVSKQGSDSTGDGSPLKPFASIQRAIKSSGNGDTVLVHNGHYYERVSFNSKQILVASEFIIDGDTLHLQNTIIDGDTLVLGVADTGSVVCFVNNEDSTSILQGLTIEGGIGTLHSGATRLGGGIFCESSSPTIKNCVIKANTAAWGGGVFYLQSPGSLKLILCDIIGNTADSAGAGIGGLYGSPASFLSCRIMNNSAPQGGGIWCRSSYSPAILNCRVANNSDGLYCCYGCGATIESSTFLNNKILGYGSSFTITRSKLESSAVDGFAHSILTDDTLYDSYVHAEDEHTARINKCRLIRSNITVHNAYAYVDSSIIAGKIRLYGGEIPYVSVTNSTLLGDSAIDQSFGFSRAELSNCILMTQGGPAIACGGLGTDRDSLACCDIFGYQSSWIEGTLALLDTVNVFFLDPLFCDTANGDYGISYNSPCAPENNQCGVLMGAFAVSCSLYVKGDANGDKKVTVSDVVYLVNYLFKGGEPPSCPPSPYLSCGDANCDGKVTVSDVVYLINYLFKGGPPPGDLNNDGIPDC